MTRVEDKLDFCVFSGEPSCFGTVKYFIYILLALVLVKAYKTQPAAKAETDQINWKTKTQGKEHMLMWSICPLLWNNAASPTSLWKLWEKKTIKKGDNSAPNVLICTDVE